MGQLSTGLIWVIFAAAAGATWVAGVQLSRATDSLDLRWSLGETFGGMLLLAIAGTLPEVAIVVTAAATHQLDLAAGNLLGGIAVQTGVLVICDAFSGSRRPLSFLVGSLIPVVEAGLVIAVTSLAALGALLPASVQIAHVSPVSLAIVGLWVGGLVLLNSVRTHERWSLSMPGSQPGRARRHHPHPTHPHPFSQLSTAKVVGIFAAMSAVTLGAGVALTTSAGELAARTGMSGMLFGATVLAIASALPEISTGVEAVRLGDNELAMGDIFGGNAFQLTLLLVADFIAGSPILAQAGAANSWLAMLGILVTAIYAVSVVVRPSRKIWGLGPDSIAVLGVLALGIYGLTLLPT